MQPEQNLQDHNLIPDTFHSKQTPQYFSETQLVPDSQSALPPLPVMPPVQGQGAEARQGSEKAYVPALSMGVYLQINGGLSPECCLSMGIIFKN